MAITYKNTKLDTVRVDLDGKMIGVIVPDKDGPGFYYSTRQGRGRSETFPSVAAVKRSLEED